MATTSPTQNPGSVRERRVTPDDLDASYGIPLTRLRLKEYTVRFTAPGQMLAIQHDLGVIPMLVLPMAESSGLAAASFWHGRPRSESFVYLKCSMAPVVCHVLIGG